MATQPRGWALCWLIADNINNEKEHKFCLPFMVCVLAPLLCLPETVKNEALGCCRDTTRIGLFYHFRMKVSSEKNAFLLSFVSYKVAK
jgi:hypothetical protein